MGNLYSDSILKVTDQTALLKFIRVANDGAANENNDANDKQYVSVHDFIYANGAWNYGATVIDDLDEIGISLTDPARYKHFTINFTITAVGFNTDLYERFTYDTNRYRLCKFKAEITKHLNLNYCLFYFIYTEFFLLYDSRQKNMMISTWGPETPGGEYIWYPIFYDLDTQLGVNNSGQVYWDYDEDATPPLALRSITREIGNETVPDVEVYSSTGSTDSIFSGNGSVLWNNMYLCFKSEIMKMYNALRKADFTQEKVEYYFETNGSDKWSPVMKNYDAYYKYLAPATVGYTDQDGNIKKTSLYYYCLQGDRSLQRKTMIRNRFNYLDSAWSAGAYDPLSTKTQIKMRYNLNDRDRTSSVVYASNATYTITPYLSQYVSVLYDETPSIVQKFKLGGNARFVTVPPPTSIQKKADLGTALTQQLAYIRGPQYLSSIGDLASKYLNELDVTNAERLRELKVGDDQDGYRNIALTSVEVGAKGLLRLVDLSNLSQLTQDPKVSGCAKLEVLKLLGTNIGEVAMPQGSVLTTVYLPATVTMISLQRPLKLDTILTTKPTHSNSGEDPIGLYIDNLTDKLPAFETTGTIPSATTTKIDLLQLDDTKLGYGSYRILNYLYNVKLEAQAGHLDSLTATTKELSISCSNVEWSPYTQVDPDTVYDATMASNYRIRENAGVTYSNYVYSSQSQWAKDVKNGLVYIYDTAKGPSPIANLDMFRHFCVEFDDTNIRYENYYFRPVGNTQGAKVIPTITGTLHVNNTEDNKINEAEIFAYFQKAGHFPKLDITANYIIPANRARFIEYAPDGTLKELYCQKYLPGIEGVSAQITYQGETPHRLHYDFLGWVEKTSNDTYDWEANCSVRNDWSYTNNGCVNLNEFSLANGSHTFIAVYAIHGYTISYYMDNGDPVTMWIEAEERDSDPVTSVAVSGQPVTFTSVVPWKDDSELPLKQTYRFKGWKLSMDPSDTKLYNNTTNRLIVDKDTAVFAVFAQENVYETPLTAEELVIQFTGSDTVGVTVPAGTGVRGKICIPSTLDLVPPTGGAMVTYRVTELLGKMQEGNDAALRGVSNTNRDGGNLSFVRKLTAVFFAGCAENATTPDYITEFKSYQFYNDSSLMYVDIPDSLRKINGNSFQNLKLSPYMNNLKNVYYIENVSFSGAFSGAAEEQEFTLYLGPDVLNGIEGLVGKIGTQSLKTPYISNIVIGSRENPVTRVRTESNVNNVFDASLQTITVYITSSSLQDTLETYFQSIYPGDWDTLQRIYIPA